MSVRTMSIGVVLVFGLASPASASLPGEGEAASADDVAMDQLIASLGVSVEQARPDLEELRQATSTVGPTQEAPPARPLELRRARPTRQGKVRLGEAFVARAFELQDGRCEPRPARINEFEESVFPSEPRPLSVCARLEDGPSRLVRVRTMITTGRGKVLVAHQSDLRFGARAEIDHVARFPGVAFPETGVYRYILEVDGERVANIPLFEVHPPPPSF